VLTISSGHSADYLTGAVATGREIYYTGAVAAGEPPGRWHGRGAETLGLAGEVDTQEMTALYERFIDPRDDAFRDPGSLGRRGVREVRAHRTEVPERGRDLCLRVGRRAGRRCGMASRAPRRGVQKARKNVAFLDATFSVQKSITVLHAAFEGQVVRARSVAANTRAAIAATTGGRGVGAAAASGASAFGAPVAAASEAPDALHRLTAELAAVAAAAEAGLTGARRAVLKLKTSAPEDQHAQPRDPGRTRRRRFALGPSVAIASDARARFSSNTETGTHGNDQSWPTCAGW